MQNEKITFSPLHEGVGFHPFSEGLPYAPQTRVNTVKTTRQLQQDARPVVQTQPAVLRTAPKTETRDLAVPVLHTPSVLRSRFFAYLLDTTAHLGFWIVVNLVAGFGFNFQLDPELLEKNWFGFLLFFGFSQWLFVALQEMLFETTLGKAFFGLEFKRMGRSFFTPALFLRSVVFMVGVCLAGIGLLYRPQDGIAEIQFKCS